MDPRRWMQTVVSWSRKTKYYITMSKGNLVTGRSDLIHPILNSLGLGDCLVSSLQLTISANDIIKVNAVIYPTEEQFVALGGEIEEFKQLTPVRSCVELVYRENELQ